MYDVLTIHYKKGTFLLQRNIFSQNKDVSYFPKPGDIIQEANSDPSQEFTVVKTENGEVHARETSGINRYFYIQAVLPHPQWLLRLKKEAIRKKKEAVAQRKREKEERKRLKELKRKQKIKK